jgi:hypothetical protein
MAGPLLPLVAAGIGAKLLLWNNRGRIVKHMMRTQVLASIGQMRMDRIRLFRSNREDIVDDAEAAIYRITCDGEGKFAPRFGLDMNLFAVAPAEKPAYVMAVPDGEMFCDAMLKLDPVEVVDPSFLRLMSEVRKEIDLINEVRKACCEKSNDRERSEPAEPAVKAADVPEEGEVSSSAAQDIAPEHSATPNQIELLHIVRADPGGVRDDVYPQSLGACMRKGWIKADKKNPSPLKSAKWWITDAGHAVLLQSKK